MDDYDTAALARTLAIESERRRSKHRRRRTAPAPKRARAWWPTIAGTAVGTGAATQTGTPAEPSPDSVTEMPGLTLAEFLDGL
jgi:hypothetical protein